MTSDNNEMNKFFHKGIVNRVSQDNNNKAHVYTDQRIEGVYEDLVEIATKLDVRFQDVEDSLGVRDEKFSRLDSSFGNELFEVNKYLKDTRQTVKKHTLMHAVHLVISVGLLVAIVLLSGCSTGIKTIFNKGYPSAVVDRTSKMACKRVISIIEVNKRVDVFGKPCQVSLVYE